MSLEGFENILSYFVGPAIIAAVITGLFSLITSRRSAKMENVIQERSKWRSKIREISDSIQIEDIPKLRKALQQLKVNINAYGLIGDANYGEKEVEQIRRDLHIWKIVYRIEDTLEYLDNKNSKGKDRKERQLKEECEVLVTYLSFLLKFDWERAKSEINQSISYVLGWILMSAGLISFIFIPRYNPSLTVIQIIVVFVYIIIVLLSSYVLERIFAEKILDYAVSNKKIKSGKRKGNMGSLIWGSLFFDLYDVYSIGIRILMLTLALLSWFFVDTIGVSVENVSVEAVSVASMLYILGTILHANEKKRILKSEFFYVLGVHAFTVEFYKKY